MKELSKFFAAPSRKLLMHKELKPINWYLIKAKARVCRQDWHDFLSQRTRYFSYRLKVFVGKSCLPSITFQYIVLCQEKRIIIYPYSCLGK